MRELRWCCWRPVCWWLQGWGTAFLIKFFKKILNFKYKNKPVYWWQQGWGSPSCPPTSPSTPRWFSPALVRWKSLWTDNDIYLHLSDGKNYKPMISDRIYRRNFLFCPVRDKKTRLCLLSDLWVLETFPLRNTGGGENLPLIWWYLTVIGSTQHLSGMRVDHASSDEHFACFVRSNCWYIFLSAQLF